LAGAVFALAVANNIVASIADVATRPASFSICREPTFDFGTAIPGAVIEHEFELQNPSNFTFTVSKVLNDCGCTLVAAEVEGKVLLPGSTLSVPVSFNTSGMTGVANTSVFVIFQGNPAPRVRLSIVGQITRVADAASKM
jgi:hypothetical protein